MLGFLSACARTSSVVPRTGGSVSTQSRSYADVPTLFDKARHKQLQSKDFDAYIDPGVSPADRKIVRRIMALMPTDARGDFLYYDDTTGRVISNNLSLARLATIEKGVVPQRPSTSSTSVRTGATTSAKRSTQATYSDSCSPPFHPGSGPYLRKVSRCNFAGGIGFVNIACNSSQMYSGDSGYVYFEVTANGQAKTLIEGGLSYLTDHFSSGNPQYTGIAPYYRSTFNSQYTNMNNNGFHYDCGLDMVIAHGVVNGASPGTKPLTYTFTAQDPPGFSPYSFWAGALYHDWINPVWGFFNAPSSMNVPGTDAAHVPTPCTICSIATVTSIAQNGGDADHGSWFGETYNGQAIHWMQVSMGEWLQGCQPGALYCKLAWSRNRNVYYGGEEIWNGLGTAVHFSGPLNLTYGPWETTDGLAEHSSPFFNNGIHPASAFSNIVPPDCATDAYGYCVAQSDGPGFHQDYVSCQVGAYQTTFGPVNVGTQWFWVKSSTDVLQQFTHHAFDNPNDPNTWDCYTGDYWDPDEPNHYFGDPNLP